jgi:hypothetical protein
MLEVNDITWYHVTWCFMYHMGSNGSMCSKSRDVCTGSLQIRFVSTILPPFIFNGMFYNRINNEKARIKSDTIWLRRFSTHFELFWAMNNQELHLYHHDHQAQTCFSTYQMIQMNHLNISSNEHLVLDSSFFLLFILQNECSSVIENHYYSVKSGKPVSGLGDGYPDRPLRLNYRFRIGRNGTGKGLNHEWWRDVGTRIQLKSNNGIKNINRI